MARRGRKPNVPTDTIIQTILTSPEGVVTTGDLGVTAKRMNDLVTEGVLALRKATQKVTDDSGSAQRGRPRKLYALSRKTKDRAKRQAAKAAA